MRKTITGNGLFVAGFNIVRIILLLLALFGLLMTRTSIPGAYFVYIGIFCIFSALLLTGRKRAFFFWVLYVFGFVLFAHLRGIVDDIGFPIQYEYPIVLERIVCFGSVPTVWLQQHLYTLGETGFFDKFMLFVYMSYFIFPHVIVFIIWKHDIQVFRRGVINLLLMFYSGLVFSIFVPTAPPWIAGQTGYLPKVYRLVRDILLPLDSQAYSQGYELVGRNDVSAMPSIHMATTMMLALLLMQVGKKAAALGLIYAAFMGLSLVYCGEHYVVDLLGGIFLSLGIWLCLNKFVIKYFH